MTTEPHFTIPASTRYSGAWGEVYSRLSVRGQINAYHIATIVALAAAYVAIQDSPRNTETIDAHLIPALLMPFVSTVFVFLYIHNEIILGLLGCYCRTLEKHDHDACGPSIPSWFFGKDTVTIDGRHYSRIQFTALSARQYSDWATISICAISPSLIILSLYHDFSANNIGFAIVSIEWVMLISALIYNAHMRRIKIID